MTLNVYILNVEGESERCETLETPCDTAKFAKPLSLGNRLALYFSFLLFTYFFSTAPYYGSD